MAEVWRTVTDPRQADEMQITEENVNRRKEFLEFRKEDADALRSLNEVAGKYADPVIEDLYRHFLSFDETQAFFRDPKVLERVKQLQKEYFLRLTAGDYGTEYVANRLRIGTVHERINLDPKWYLGAYNMRAGFTVCTSKGRSTRPGLRPNHIRNLPTTRNCRRSRSRKEQSGERPEHW